jgi:hypothetical protein
MNTEVLIDPRVLEAAAQELSTKLAYEASQSSSAQTEQPVALREPANREGLNRGSLVQILAVKRPFLERQAVKPPANGTRTVKPGRVPGRDLSGRDLIGAVGTIIQQPDATRYPVPNNPDPLVLVRVGDENLYLNLSEVAPVEPEPIRD